MLLLCGVERRQSFGGFLLLSKQHVVVDGAAAWEVRDLELSSDVVTK